MSTNSKFGGDFLEEFRVGEKVYIKMSKKLSKTEIRDFMSHECMRIGISQSFGKKSKGKGKKLSVEEKNEYLDYTGVASKLPETYKKFVSYRNKCITVMKAWLKFTEMSNPTEAMEWLFECNQDLQKTQMAIIKLESLIDWYISVRKIKRDSAITYRGILKGLISGNFKHNFATNDDRQEMSDADLADQARGIGIDEKYEIIHKMFDMGDIEMKAFIACGLGCGHRGSDIVKKNIETHKIWFEKGLDYTVVRQIDIKQGAQIASCYTPWAKKVILDYMATIDDDREYIFGDGSERNKRRLGEKWNSLLHKKGVYDGDDNVVTPHDMRKIFETKAKRWFEIVDIYGFTGHKTNKTYIQSTNDDLIRIANQMAEITSFGYIKMMKDDDSISADKVVGIMSEMMTDMGKLNHFQHMFHDFNKDPEAFGEVSKEKEIRMKIAGGLGAF